MRINVVAFSTNGCRTSIRIRDSMPGDDVRLFCKTTSERLGVQQIEGKTIDWVGESFKECDAIVFVGSIGIATRYIAPYIRSKDVDPAIVCLDEHAHYTVPILSGHIGGANDLARRIAALLDSEAVITTATDINGRFSVDSFAVANGLRIMGLKTAKDVSARVLDDRFVGFCSDHPVEGEFPLGMVPATEGEFGVSISTDPDRRPFDTTMRLIPMDIDGGVGCRRDTDPGALEEFVTGKLRELGISRARVGSVASIDLKKDEEAVLALARGFRAPARFYTAEELMAVPGEFSESQFVKGITSVDCVCERSAVASGGGELILRKTSENGMTLALAKREIKLRFLK